MTHKKVAIHLIGLEETGLNAMIDFAKMIGVGVERRQTSIPLGAKMKENTIYVSEYISTNTKAAEQLFVYCDLWDYIIYSEKNNGKTREEAKQEWIDFVKRGLTTPNAEWISSYAFMQQPLTFFSYLNNHASFSVNLNLIKERYSDFYNEAYFHTGHTIELIRWCKADEECSFLIKKLHQIAVLPHDIILESTYSRKVDVIIPCYNLGHLLEDTLASLERSFNDNINVCIIDDGSTQPQTIDGLKKAESFGYKVIRQSNTGLCKALNNAIEKCNSEYLLVLSADDKVDPKFITQSLKILEQQQEVGVVYCNPKTFEAWYSMWLTPDFDAAQFLSLNFIVATSVYRRKYWEQAGGYDPNTDGNEDWEMWMNCLEHGAKFHHIDEYLFQYRYRAGSKIQTVYKPDGRKKLVSYMSNKHHSLYAQYLPQIIGNLHYAIATSEKQYIEGKSIDQIEVETGARKLGLLGTLMYRTLRKIGHISRKREE